MTLPKFEYVAPESLQEACQLLRSRNGEAAVMAGGTDLLIKLRARRMQVKTVIGLKKIKGLDRIAFDRKQGLTIGATALLSSVAANLDVLRWYPTVAYAAGETATVQIRNMGTVVGNLCNAAPSADNAPILLAMEAQVIIMGPEGERRLPLSDFFKGPGLTALEPGELVEALFLPLPPPHSGTAYQHVSERGKVDIAAASAAVIVVMSGQRCLDVKIALGAVAPIPMRAFGAEKVLKGNEWDSNLVEKAALRASRESRPITDMRATATYRKKMVQILTKRALTAAHKMAAQ